MIIQIFPCPPYATNAYVVGCPKTRFAAVIDPAPQATPLVVQWLSDHSFTLDKIILTHSHWDHIADVAPLKKIFDVPVFVHQFDRGNLEHPGSDGLPLVVPVEAVSGALSMAEGETIKVGDINFKIIHTPGHTPGGVCLFCEEEGILFSGDTLFQGAIGNLSLPTGDPQAMWGSLRKLGTLPPETKVYPGHGPTTTVQAEKRWLNR